VCAYLLAATTPAPASSKTCNLRSHLGLGVSLDTISTCQYVHIIPKGGLHDALNAGAGQYFSRSGRDRGVGRGGGLRWSWPAIHPMQMGQTLAQPRTASKDCTAALAHYGNGSLGHCPQRGTPVHCLAFKGPDKAALHSRMEMQGPVLASAKRMAERTASISKRAGPLHLFVMAGAGTGSSALLALLVSSPNVTFLKTERLGEGMWALQRAGLFTWKRRWEPELPRDWGAAMRVWDNIWDPSKSVRVEKSPEWHIPGRMERILDYFKGSKRSVGLLFMSRSSCYRAAALNGHEQNYPCHDIQSMLLHAVYAVRKANIRWTMVAYEDLLRDPYVVAAHILRAFPEIGLINPNAQSPQVWHHGRNRHSSKSIVQYILAHETFQNSNHTTSAQAMLDNCLGYDQGGQGGPETDSAASE